MNEKFTRLIQDTLIFALGNLGSKIILFFMVPLYTNYLSREEYGIAEYVFTMSSLLVPIVSISIWEGIVRIGLKKGIAKEDVICNSLLVFLFSTILVVVTTPLWQLYEPIAQWRAYLAAYSLAYILNQILLNYIKIKEKNKLFAIASVTQTLVLAILNIILLVWFHAGIKGYLISNIFAVAFSDLLIILGANLASDLKAGHIRLDILKSMLLYSAPLVVNNTSWWVIHSSDKIMIESMLSAGELGLYTVASKIPSLINVLVAVFTQAWGLSSIREMEASNDEKYYTNVFEAYSVILFTFMLVFTLFLKPFMSIYVGKDFIDAWRYVSLLFYAAIFQAFSAYFGGLLGALQKSGTTMVTTLIGGVVNIILNYIFIKTIGIWGALIGTVSAFVIITIMRRFIIKKYIPLSINWIKYLFNSLICLSVAIASSIIENGYYITLIGMMAFVIININQINKLFNLAKHTVIELLHRRR